MVNMLIPTCIFCLKPIPQTKRAQKKDKVLEIFDCDDDKEVERFFKLASRYVFAHNQKESGNMKNVIKVCCVGCLGIIKSFNQLYHEMECLKLQLNWKLTRLKNRTEYANTVPSRFQRIKANATLEEKSDILKDMMTYRRDFVENFSIHLLKSTPKVALNRNESFPSEKVIRMPIHNRETVHETECHIKIEPVENCLENDSISTTNSLPEYPEEVPMDFQYHIPDVKPFPNPLDGSPSLNLDTYLQTTPNLKKTQIILNKFKCKHCPSTFMKQDKLVRHTWYEHTCKGKRPRDQIIIPETSTTIGDWVNKTGAKFKCSEDTCNNAIFMTENGLQDHIKLHGSFPCQFCKEVKTFAPDLATHELKVHGTVKKSSKIKQCPRCEYKIPKHMPHESYLNHYLLKHHNLLMDCCRCPFCKKAFLSKANRELMRSILVHWLNFHDNSNIKNPRKCGPRVGQLNKAIEHAAIKKKKKVRKLLHYCQQCKKSFPDVYKLKRHCFAIHQPSDSENAMWNWKYECKKCGKKFWDKYVFERHQKTLHKHKRFVCQICGTKSLNKKGLQAHNLRSHSKKIK